MEICFLPSYPKNKKLGTAPVGVFFLIIDSQLSTQTKLYFFFRNLK